MTTRMPPVMDPTAALRAERDQVLAALADVLRYVEPCGHEPPDHCCTDCHARALIARYQEGPNDSEASMARHTHWLDTIPTEVLEVMVDVVEYVLEPNASNRRRLERHRDALDAELYQRQTTPSRPTPAGKGSDCCVRRSISAAVRGWP